MVSCIAVAERAVSLMWKYIGYRAVVSEFVAVADTGIVDGIGLQLLAPLVGDLEAEALSRLIDHCDTLILLLCWVSARLKGLPAHGIQIGWQSKLHPKFHTTSLQPVDGFFPIGLLPSHHLSPSRNFEHTDMRSTRHSANQILGPMSQNMIARKTNYFKMLKIVRSSARRFVVVHSEIYISYKPKGIKVRGRESLAQFAFGNGQARSDQVRP